jgi:hypothetical protein
VYAVGFLMLAIEERSRMGNVPIPQELTLLQPWI